MSRRFASEASRHHPSGPPPVRGGSRAVRVVSCRRDPRRGLRLLLRRQVAQGPSRHRRPGAVPARAARRRSTPPTASCWPTSTSRTARSSRSRRSRPTWPTRSSRSRTSASTSTRGSTRVGIGARRGHRRHRRAARRGGRVDDHAAVHPQHDPVARALRHHLDRKIREMYLAPELEKRHTKDEILEMYLNTVYFGDGAYGAEAARTSFFGKPANQLTLAEAALLAGLPQSPIRLNPRYEQTPARDARQRWVLGRMVANKYITRRRPTRPSRSSSNWPTHGRPDGQGIYDCATSSPTCASSCSQQYTDARRVQGRPARSTRRSTRGCSATPRRRVKRHPAEHEDPDAALVSIDPQQRLHQGDVRRHGLQREHATTPPRRASGSRARRSRRSCS